MKSLGRKILLGLLAVSLPTSAMAAPGWGSVLTITAVMPIDWTFQFGVSGNDNPMGCSSPTWMRVEFTNPGFHAITATILSAFAQGKTIRAWQNSCAPDGAIIVNGVWVDR